MAETGVEPSLAALTDALGARCREPRADELAELAPLGLAPQLVCAPQSVDEVSAALRAASAAGLAVIPRGGGTQLALGASPRRSDVLLELSAFSDVLEYTPEDMTVTVQAGLPLSQLQRVLAEHGQFLPLNPPLRPEATIGGIMAANAHGSWRARHGAMRDLVIGSRIVHGDGLVSHSGGKVVKNVAGYDLSKAWVGSLGTLGVLVEVTFKLQPLPAARGWSRATFAGPEPATAAAYALARSTLPYVGVELVNPPLARTLGFAEEYVLVVEWAAPAPAVERCQREWPAVAGDAARTAGPCAGPPAVPVWPASSEDLVLRVSLPVGQVGAFLTELASTWPAALATAQAATGTVCVTSAPADAGGAAAVRHLRAVATALGGWLVVESAPLALKQQIDVWGPPAGPLDLMRRLKHAYDPAGVLNPGRFVGGL